MAKTVRERSTFRIQRLSAGSENRRVGANWAVEILSFGRIRISGGQWCLIVQRASPHPLDFALFGFRHSAIRPTSDAGSNQRAAASKVLPSPARNHVRASSVLRCFPIGESTRLDGKLCVKLPSIMARPTSASQEKYSRRHSTGRTGVASLFVCSMTEERALSRARDYFLAHLA